jgi:ABC-type branched-subunit amino acid transport system ATPase component
MTAPLLEIRGLSVGYGAVPAVAEVSLAVGVGEAVALLGANGAGKTTLLKAVIGLAPTHSGTIALAGRAIETLKPEALGVDVTPRLSVLKVEEPPKRQAGKKVGSVQELVDKLRNEAKVI